MLSLFHNNASSEITISEVVYLPSSIIANINGTVSNNISQVVYLKFVLSLFLLRFVGCVLHCRLFTQQVTQWSRDNHANMCEHCDECTSNRQHGALLLVNYSLH